MRVFVKMLLALALIFLYVSSSAAIIMSSFYSRRRRQRLVRNAAFFSRLALKALGVHLRVRNRGRLCKRKAGRLVVANHVSSIDILILASLKPSVFITSVELGNTPLAGIIARLGGSIFVERRRITGLRREISEIAGALKDGFTVALFPEGTTSDGEGVRPFKNSLFEAAVKTGALVIPVCITYKMIDGRQLTPYNRDRIFYYGRMNFLIHAMRLLTVRRIDAEVQILEPLKPKMGGSRKDLSVMSHRKICSVYKPVSISS